MRPGDTINKRIRILDAATGLGVTGLTLAALTITAMAKGYAATDYTAWTHGATLTEIGSGRYRLSFTAPPLSGEWFLDADPVSDAHLVTPAGWEGEIESYDLDAVAAAAILPSVAVGAASSVQLGRQITLELVAYRYREVSLAITDEDGNPLPLDGYSGWAVSFRSADQTTTKYDLTTGITGTIGGLLSFAIPEDATALFSGLPVGASSVNLFWEVVADIGGVASRTVPIIRSSPCLLTRREVGT